MTRVRMRSWLLALAIPLAAWPTSAAAERASGPTRKPVALAVWELPRPERTGIKAKTDRALIRAFKAYYRKKHGREIRLTSPTGISIPSEGGMDTRPLMAIAGGVSPDVIYVNFRQSDTYIQEGFLYPLDKWVEPLKRDREAEWRERVPRQVEKVIHRWGPGKKTGTDPDKHTWALPHGIYVKGLVWRKDLFKAVGLDPDRPPKDWDEYYRFAQQCTDPVKGTYGIQMPQGGWYFYSLLVSAGARVMQDVREDEWEATFNTPEAAEAYGFYLKLQQGKWRHRPSGKIVEGVVFTESETAGMMWSQGRIGMREAYFTDDKLADINPELIGIAPVPAHPTKGRASELNCTMCGIFSGAAKKGPEVLEAAWEYVYFLGSPMAKEIRTRVMVENGYGMFANPVYLEKLGYDDYLRRIPPSWREVFNEALENGEPEPYGRNCQRVYNYMEQPADKMILEGLGYRVFDAVETARKTIRAEQPDISAEALEAKLAVVRETTRAEVRERIQARLDEAVARANQVMIGNIPPGEMAFRRLVSWVVATTIVVAFALLFRYVWKLFKPPEAKGGWLFRRYWLAYLILVPAVGTIALWRYVPMVRGAFIAFQDYHIVRLSTWIGIDNFADVLWDPEFWQALRNSLWYAFLAISMGFCAPIILAIMLHEVPRGKILFRTLYYLPAVLSGLVVMLMWKAFFDPKPEGLLNQVVTVVKPWMLLTVLAVMVAGCAASAFFNWRQKRNKDAVFMGVLGTLAAVAAIWLLFRVGMVLNPEVWLEPKKWLKDPDWAMFCVVLPTIWAGVGPGCLIYLAALKTIPEEIYEAADLDGAGFLGKAWHITIPSIKVLILINFIGAVVNAFRVSGYILAMTGGGPAGATKVMALKVFFEAFVYLRFGVATATAWVLGAMLIGFTVFQLRRLSRVEFRTAAGK